ncbi:substrate-binding periplasmic protein [Roseateles saccharophilus]|uniref:substrate-binding periplasmic protein n=1 Tax=Roseateles saccharophilus TaxID=304 RepID=UPI0014048416|nr:transporter substrate-binding domain-containing protein [Roseateles saccharophilus]
MRRLLHLIAVLAICTAPALARGCELRVRWNPDPPFSMRDADGHLVGLRVELAEHTLERMGCHAIWVELPWARALIELEAGRLDILQGSVRRPEREAYARMLDEPFTVSNRLYVRTADRAAFGSASRLQQAWRPGLKLGVQIGVVYGADYAQMLLDDRFRAVLTQAPVRRSLWQMLDIGRIDAVLADEVTARWELAELGLGARVQPTAVTMGEAPAQVMFSRRSVDPALVERYREASESLRRDGSLGRIQGKYLGDPG